METDHSQTEKGSSTVGTTPHLHKQPLLVLLELVPCRASNLVQLSLKFVLVNIAISESSQSFLGFLFLTLDHEPSGAFGEEDDHDALDCGSHEENGQWDLIGSLAHHGVRSKVNTCACDGTDRKHDLVETEDYTPEMGRSCLVDVELGESEEPSNGNT